ncbi:unnamed protein product, partial [Phaeothamnion confervicola]
QDIDDALHVSLIGGGVVEVGVHIADVTHFVAEGSVLDFEAAKRGTTTYLTQNVTSCCRRPTRPPRQAIPMLPPILSEQLCSLLPNVDRLAFSVIFKMTMDGALLEEAPFFGRTVIRSKARLDYATAQRIIDGVIDLDNPATLTEETWETARRSQDKALMSAVVMSVKLLDSVARRRREKRFASGALCLNNTKLCFDLWRTKSGGGVEPRSCHASAISEANNLIEEYMLTANFLVAQKILTSGAGDFALLRRQPEPVTKGLSDLKDLLASRGMELDISSSLAFHKSLSRIRKGDPLISKASCFPLLQMLATAPMKVAEYFAAGLEEPSAWRHYALAMPAYTHFTSPIRRYADCCVHRLLTRALRNGAATAVEVRKLKQLAEHLNERRMAAQA